MMINYEYKYSIFQIRVFMGDSECFERIRIGKGN